MTQKQNNWRAEGKRNKNRKIIKIKNTKYKGHKDIKKRRTKAKAGSMKRLIISCPQQDSARKKKKKKRQQKIMGRGP